MFAQHPQRLPEVAPPQTDAEVIAAEVEHIAGRIIKLFSSSTSRQKSAAGVVADKLREGD